MHGQPTGGDLGFVLALLLHFSLVMSFLADQTEALRQRLAHDTGSARHQ